MKQSLYLAVAMMVVGLLLTSQVLAVPAHPGRMKVRQPDGTTISIRLHGNEYQHYSTTDDGYTILRNAEGYYVYAIPDGGRLTPSSTIAHDPDGRSASEQAFLQRISRQARPSAPTRRSPAIGNSPLRRAGGRSNYDLSKFRGLVILVEFKDKKFSRADYDQVANDIFNKPNFIGFLPSDPFPGSVRDYFSDMSDGRFQPQFDVVGPVKIKYSQYDANGYEDAWKLTLAAVNAADSRVDFSRYDTDNDRMVDLIYFIFAGYGSNFAGNDERLIWPHADMVYDIDEAGNYHWVVKDGVYLSDCACSTELEGWTDEPSTVRLDGIGSICHEFSHVMGLPDFYDVDQEESGGFSSGPGIWDVMASGCYGTPVAYSLYERWFMGWAEPQDIDTLGTYTLERLSKNVGYRLYTPDESEFFLLENRQKDDKWNESLPGHGMMVYRVDMTDLQVWDLNNNSVNCDPSHNYYELLRAKPDIGYDSDYDPFPGRGLVTSLTNYTSPSLRSWAGKECPLALINIREENFLITFDVVDAHSEVGISSPLTGQQSAPPLIFTPDGRQVSDMSRPGLYILREGSTTRKVKQ